MVSLRSLVVLGLALAVNADISPQRCRELSQIAQAGGLGTDSASLSSFCTSALGYTVPPAVTVTKTQSHYNTITKVAVATATATSTVTVVTTTTIITTVYSKKRDAARDFLQARQDLGSLPYALIQDLCDCLGVAHPATPTKTTTTVKEVTETKSATLTTTTTVKTTTTSTATAYITTTAPRVTVSKTTAAPSATYAPSPDGLCGVDYDNTCTGASFGACCSQFGFCGDTAGYCGTGCQPGYGKCT